MSEPLKDKFPQQTGWRGQHSGVSSPGAFVATTQEEWESLWNLTHSDRSPAPKAPQLPEGKMAIGIFAGATNKPVDIKVTGMEWVKGCAIFNYTAEAKSSMMAVMNNPFLLKFVEKIDMNAVLLQEVASKTSAQPATGIKKKPNYDFLGGY